MINIEYPDLTNLDRRALLNILNREKNREHLVSHAVFDETALEEWITSKAEVNSLKGRKVKGVTADGSVAGWCGIQCENNAYELAIVLDENYWGMGISVFKKLMQWASELGHNHVVLHLLNTRPEYKFLKKMAEHVYESTIFGEKYTSYQLRVR